MGKKINKKKKNNLIFIFIFILGFLILLYPLISRFYYRIESNENVKVFNEGKSKLSEEEINQRMELARAFNASLTGDNIEDPYSDEKKAEGRAEYATMLEIKQQIGHIKIPKINITIPTYAGTSDEVLQKAVGHLEGTSLPIGGSSTHSVITAHRGLAKAKLFRDLNKLEIGDVFLIHNIETVLAYEVDQILTVEPDNFEPVLVLEGQDYFTLLTCTPYMINSHRLLVRGHRIDYIPAIEEEKLNMLGIDFTHRDILMFLVPTILVMLAVTVFNTLEIKKAIKI